MLARAVAAEWPLADGLREKALADLQEAAREMQATQWAAGMAALSISGTAPVGESRIQPLADDDRIRLRGRHRRR